MDNNVVETCVVCHTEKSVDNFYNKYIECNECNIKRVLKRYYDNKYRILQKRGDKYARFEDLDNRLKALEEKITKNDSEKN